MPRGNAERTDAATTAVGRILVPSGRSPTARLLLRRLGPLLLLVALLPRGVRRLSELLGAEPATAAAVADLAVAGLFAAALVVVGSTVDALQTDRARSGSLLRGVLSALHEGLIVRSADGHLVVANPAADQMVGLRFADDPDHATMIEKGGLRDEDGRPLTVADLPSTAVRRTGEPVLGRVFRLGSDADRAIWVRTNCVPFEDAQGRIGTISTFSDVTSDHEMATALAEAEARFRLAFEQAPIGIGVVRLDGSFQDANPALCAVLGRSREEVLALTFQELTHPDDLDADLALMDDLLAGRTDSFQLDKRYLRPDGSAVWVSLHVSAVRDAEGTAQRFLSQVVDLTERKHLELQLEHAATHDPLTGVPNRRLLADRLGVALATARRDGGAVAVLFCDLDGFKAINDTYGHGVGDLMLTAVADRLQRAGREVDTVGRIGGDEFVVIAGGVEDAATAEQLAERVRRTVEEPLTVEGATLHPRVSVGLHLDDGTGTAEEALTRADHRMYALKTARRQAARSTA